MTSPSDYYGQTSSGEVAGHAYAAQSSTRVDARLVRDAKGLRLLAGNGDVLYAGPPTTRERVSGGPVLMHFGGDLNWSTQHTVRTSLLASDIARSCEA
ncbi:hypothetical protein, partial [Pacificibacter sp. AS14]|uniref:hypothetical protein n=1 Tax=Pacificibacter sp. AS14 TaxID=3135785 RepID=UPI00317AF900